MGRKGRSIKGQRTRRLRPRLCQRPSDIIWLPEHIDAFMKWPILRCRWLWCSLCIPANDREISCGWPGGNIRRHVTSSCGRASLTRWRPAASGTHPLHKSPLKATLESLPRRAAVIMTTKTGRSFKKRYFAEQWEETCKTAGIADLHFHDIRGTTVTMLFQAGCNLGEIVSITGHSLRRAQEILDKYLARTSKLGGQRHRKIRERLGNRFCKTGCKT